MKLKSSLPILAALLLPESTFAVVPAPSNAPVTLNVTEIHGAAPAETARIVKYSLAPPERGSGDETGALHIMYSDRTQVVEYLLPRIKSPPGDFIGNESGFAQVKIAVDRRTIGWLEDYETESSSYPQPIMLAIYSSGRAILHLMQGQTVWYWEFQQDGRQVVAAWGASHGPVVLDYQLYDTATGDLLGETAGEGKTQSLPGNAPAWARAAETACGRHCRGSGR